MLDAGFWAIAFVFLLVMSSSAIPTPLYVLFQERDGFSTLMITVVFGVYAFGVMAGLLLAGHTSDWLGRRRVLAPAVALSTASSLVFLLWQDLPGLIVGRVLSGVSVGVVTATATAYLAELHAAGHPDDPPRRGQVLSTAANLAGLGLGPLFAGLIAQFADGPLTLPFEIFIPLLALGTVAVVLVPETRHPAVPRPAYRPQRVAVPPEGRREFFAAATAAAIAFATFGLCSALTGSFLAGPLGRSSLALSGAVIGAIYVASALAQSLTASRPVREVLVGGMWALVTGVLLMVVAMWLASPSLALFLAGGAVSGAGAGMLFKGTISTVSRLAAPESRAEVLAGLFVAAYLGVSVPVIGLGVLTEFVEPRMVVLVFAGLVAACVLAAARPVLGDRAPVKA